MLLGVFNLAALLPEGVSRFHKRMHEYEEFSKKREKTKASMAAMKKEIESFVVKEKSWVVKVHELTKRHKIELNDVKKRMEADRLQLKADRVALNVQQKAFLNEKEGLKASLSQATSDNQWLIEHGFQQVLPIFSIQLSSILLLVMFTQSSLITASTWVLLLVTRLMNLATLKNNLLSISL
ncbi:hypothetical protein Hdeb2414_s0012g00385151 [Helianthus debilis subsp. tardiflorus]